MPLFFLVFAGVMWLIFAPSKKDGEATAGQDGFNSEVPMPEDDGLVSDKITAYEQESLRERKQEKMRSLQDFSAMFGEPGETEEERLAREERQIAMAPKPPEYYDNPEMFEGGGSGSRGGTLQSSAYAYRDINRQLGEWYEEPAETEEPVPSAVEERMLELERRLSEAEALKAAEDEQTALLERSYRMAARYMPGGAAQGAGNDAASGAGSPAPKAGQSGKVIARPVSQVRESVVSLLLPEILKIYDYDLPKIPSYTFNERVKELGQRAKLQQKIEVVRKKGTLRVKEVREKWEMISSHTCRRSFCTNMYLSGFPAEELMRISGHKSPAAFMRYIKVDNMQAANRLKELRAKLAR